MTQSTSEKLLEQFKIFEAEDAKATSGNKAATTRARKALMEIKNLATTRRKELTDLKNGGGSTRE